MMQSINPATGEEIARYDETSPAALDAALSSAHEAAHHWRASRMAERCERLRAAAAVLRRDRDELAQLATREMGKPLREALVEVDKCAWACEHYADVAAALLAPESVTTDATRSYVRFEPLGVVLGIMPWNFPYWQLFRFAAPTLAAGNVVILKHAENTTGCGLRLARLFADAGFPEGVFTPVVVSRERVAAIIADARVAAVSLTGSVRAGRAVGAAAGAALKPCVLELGGSDPFIVLADAELGGAVSAALTSRMVNSGQSCIAAKRFIVEAAIHDELVTALRQGIARLQVGDPLRPETQIGPLARTDLVDALDGQVRASVAAGAKLLAGGARLQGPGCFYGPTLLVDVAPGMPAFDEETFGPVAAVIRARDTEEAIALANRSIYGLGATLWTEARRGDELAPRIEAGHVAINGIVKSDPRLPFGGIKQSGLGRELGRYGLLAFTNIKSVWLGPARA